MKQYRLKISVKLELKKNFLITIKSKQYKLLAF